MDVTHTHKHYHIHIHRQPTTTKNRFPKFKIKNEDKMPITKVIGQTSASDCPTVQFAYSFYRNSKAKVSQNALFGHPKKKKETKKTKSTIKRVVIYLLDFLCNLILIKLIVIPMILY